MPEEENLTEDERKMLVAYRTKKLKSKIDFSKKLAIMITVIFALTWAIGWGMWLVRGTLPTEMLDYITMPFSVVITGYFAKAGVENYTKINVKGNEL
jgi:hypothetical protein